MCGTTLCFAGGFVIPTWPMTDRTFIFKAAILRVLSTLPGIKGSSLTGRAQSRSLNFALSLFTRYSHAAADIGAQAIVQSCSVLSRALATPFTICYGFCLDCPPPLVVSSPLSSPHYPPFHSLYLRLVHHRQDGAPVDSSSYRLSNLTFISVRLPPHHQTRISWSNIPGVSFLAIYSFSQHAYVGTPKYALPFNMHK